MIQAIWPNKKSQMYSDIRIAVKTKTEKGQPTLSRKEANRAWREDFLGILSEEQKKQQKEMRQKKEIKHKKKRSPEEEE